MRYEARVDTILAKLYNIQNDKGINVARALDTLHYAAGDKKVTKSRWGMTTAEARVNIAKNGYGMDPSKRHAEAVAKLDAALAARQHVSNRIASVDKAYTGWSRFFLVLNNGGHIHSSMHCSTCFPTTQFGWNPELSGMSEAEAVAALGPKLCTVCFPSAPVEWTVGEKKEDGCEGTGRAPVNVRGRYGACPSCGYFGAITAYGAVRKHKATVK